MAFDVNLAPPPGFEPRPREPKSRRLPNYHKGEKLGYQDSNLEQEYQRLPCCQLHHSPMFLRPAPRNRTSYAFRRLIYSQRSGHRSHTGWSDHRESNPGRQSHILRCCHYTMVTAPPEGLEPSTIALTGRRNCQLCYGGKLPGAYSGDCATEQAPGKLRNTARDSLHR